MKRFSAIVTFVVCLLCAGLGAQQTPALQPEDLCTLDGRIVNAITGEPVNKATVILSSKVPGAAAGALKVPQQFGTSTDSTGRFAMKDLEPGTYMLQITRNGYVSYEYGQRSPQASGTPLTLVRGQKLKDVAVRLTPHGVVAGRVIDEDGEPIPSVMIQLLKPQYSNGKKQLATAASAQTNDLGEFRAASVAPGRYYVVASLSTSASALLSSLTVDKSEQPRPPMNYVPTYYPAATDAVSATPIDIAAGATVNGVNIAMAKKRTVRVTGHVVAPAPAQMLILAPRSLTGALSMQIVRVDPKGDFDIRGVAAGSYALTGSVQQGGKAVSANLPIEVGQNDVEGLVFTIGGAITVTGTVKVDGETREDLSRLSVRLQPRELGMGAVMSLIGSALSGGGIGAESGKLGDGGSFRIENVSSDRYELSVSGLPQGFYLKSARTGETDALAAGLDISSAAPDPLEIVISPGAGQISGAVRNSATQLPAAQTVVALVPREAGRVEQSRFYQQTNSDAAGQFSFKGVPPGDYRVFAWEDVENGAWMDPDFLKPQEAKGQTVTVHEKGLESVQVAVISSEKK